MVVKARGQRIWRPNRGGVRNCSPRIRLDSIYISFILSRELYCDCYSLSILIRCVRCIVIMYVQQAYASTSSVGLRPGTSQGRI